MSGPLKLFFDRISDLLNSQKELGRQLRGKRMSILSVSNDAFVNTSFYEAFRLSAAYLGMDYGPVWHGWVADGKVSMMEKPIKEIS